MQKLLEKLGFSESAASAALWIILSVVLVAVIALLAMWLVRTLRPSLNINGGANRGGRPQRLAITDAFPLDRDGRKLVIVRRDNIEHLLLIGGPNDVLVEGNITRHDRASRLGGRGTENEADDALVPAAPPMSVAPQMPVAPMVPPPAPLVVPPAPQPVPPPVVAQQPPVTPPPVMPPVMPPAPRREPIPPTPAAPAPAAPPAAMVAPPVLTLEALLADATPVLPDAKTAAHAETVAEPAPAEASPAPTASPPPAPEPAAPPAARPPAMSEMARRLNEALQKPVSGTLRPPFNRSIPPAPPTSGPSASPTPPVTPVAAQAAPAPVAEVPPKPVAPPAAEPVAKADMDLLEEEMARLLGRPAQPKKTDGA